MELELFENILDFFDKKLYGNKISSTGFRYTGIVLDDYFENSVLQCDHLNLKYYFLDIGIEEFDENKYFRELYLNIPEKKRISLVEKILLIVKKTSYNKEENIQILNSIFTFLKRNNYEVLNNDSELKIFKNTLIGEGSYCEVYNETERTVKKILKSDYSDKEDFKKRLKYEFENTLKLKESPNIIKVIKYNSENNSYIMEKCEDDLYSFLKKNIEISPSTKIKIVMDILQGMKYAHDNNIIHRDLHLGNILKIGETFVIADFGWSKDLKISRSLRSSSTPKSSNRYVAPEAISDFNKLDKKTDIYSLGQILGDIFRNSITSINEYSPIINKCIERDRDKRYNDIDLIIKDFQLVLKKEEEKVKKENILKNIKNSKQNAQVQDFILNLAKEANLSYFIVEHKLTNFGKLILQFSTSDQIILMNSIEENFKNATGYNNWENYDIFTNISYDIYINNKANQLIKEIALNIIEYCANIVNRYHAKNILDNLKKI